MTVYEDFTTGLMRTRGAGVSGKEQHSRSEEHSSPYRHHCHIRYLVRRSRSGEWGGERGVYKKRLIHRHQHHTNTNTNFMVEKNEPILTSW